MGFELDALGNCAIYASDVGGAYAFCCGTREAANEVYAMGTGRRAGQIFVCAAYICMECQAGACVRHPFLVGQHWLICVSSSDITSLSFGRCAHSTFFFFSPVSYFLLPFRVLISSASYHLLHQAETHTRLQFPPQNITNVVPRPQVRLPHRAVFNRHRHARVPADAPCTRVLTAALCLLHVSVLVHGRCEPRDTLAGRVVPTQLE